jgi:hypothetical protein
VRFKRSCGREMQLWRFFKLGCEPYALGTWKQSPHFLRHIAYSMLYGMHALSTGDSQPQSESPSLSPSSHGRTTSQNMDGTTETGTETRGT